MPTLITAQISSDRLPTGSLVIAGALALLIAFGLASSNPTHALVFAGAATVTAFATSFRPGPVIQLGFVLLFSAFQIFGGDGTQIGELVSGLVLVGYLAYWYTTAVLSPRPIVTSFFDLAAVAWGVVGIPAATLWGIWMGANSFLLRADILAAIPFLLYLPVKDICTRYERGALSVALALVVYGLAGTAFGFINLRGVIAGASEYWQIADARYNLSETGITSGLLLALASLPAAWNNQSRWRPLLLTALFGLALVLFGGLVLTKSRGFWAAGVIGIICVLTFTRGRNRRHATIGLVAIVLTMGVGALLVLGDAAVLLAIGTLNRLATLENAVTKDISLLNRFAESAAAFDLIREQPLLGWGFGRDIPFFNIILRKTTFTGFVHNGFVALWLKTGTVGLFLMGVVWGGAILRSLSALLRKTLSASLTAITIGLVSALIAFTPVVSTSNPFSILDQMLVVTLLMGALHGLADRSRWHREADRSPTS
ncbi:MAG: O-antigen ligase family protein [Bacteroidota bacterium]